MKIILFVSTGPNNLNSPAPSGRGGVIEAFFTFAGASAPFYSKLIYEITSFLFPKV